MDERGGSPHFALSEFACPHCGVAKATPELLAALERLRLELGRPIKITSGYRCPTYNQRVGGAARSQHLLGKAADISTARAGYRQAVRAGFNGIGLQGPIVVHADVRRPPQALWHY